MIKTDDILEWEADSIIDAIGNSIELNDTFLKLYCNQEFQELMADIPEYDREYVLSGIDVDSTWNSFPPGNEWQHIWIDISEIEYQFEGDPKEMFEDLEDLVINGDLAYLYTGYGLSLNYNRDQLLESIKDYKENFSNEN